MFHITQKNGFKVGRSTAKLYTRTTGIKVDDKKIIGKNISTRNNRQITTKFSDYYKTVTLTDKKDAITSAIEDDNKKNTIIIDNKLRNVFLLNMN